MTKKLLHICMRIALSKHGPTHPYWNCKGIHYSFIVRNNKILAIGLNRKDAPPPVHYGYPKWAPRHSEIDVWRKARGLLKGEEFELVNIRLLMQKDLRDNWIIGSSEPCPECLSFITSQGCTKVYYTTSRGKFSYFSP